MEKLKGHDFTVLGFHDGVISFWRNRKWISIRKSLPKEDLVLELGIHPVNVSKSRDEILFEASKIGMCDIRWTGENCDELLVELENGQFKVFYEKVG